MQFGYYWIALTNVKYGIIMLLLFNNAIYSYDLAKEVISYWAGILRIWIDIGIQRKHEHAPD